MDEQRSDDWFTSRLGKATASRFADIMRGSRLAGWKNYKAQLVAERLTGRREETWTSREMQHGIDTEPLARLMYSLHSGHIVELTGFIPHTELAAGASPDGLIGDDGGLEIKCPNSATHLHTLRSAKVPVQYLPQIYGALWITGRAWWDFVSFDPRLPTNAQLIVIRVQRDEDRIAELAATVTAFLEEVDKETEFVENYAL